MMLSKTELMSENTSLLKASDVAKILNISRPMAYRLTSTGELPSVRIGGSVRVRKEDLEKYINQCWTGWKTI